MRHIIRFALIACLCLSACNENNAPTSAGDSAVPPPPAPSATAAPVKASQAFGQELSPNGNAASDGQTEADGVSPYEGTYDCSVSSVESSKEPGQAGAGKYCLKIVADQNKRSGIRQADSFFKLEPGKKYMVSCKIFCAEARPEFKIGVKDAKAGNLWAYDLDRNVPVFPNTAGQWTAMKGILTIPPDASGNVGMWITHWGEKPLTWYLDDISVREATVQ